jgi:hypothetical protein
MITIRQIAWIGWMLVLGAVMILGVCLSPGKTD